MSSCNDVKNAITNSILKVASNVSSYVENPNKDMTRKRKFPTETVLSYLISQGSSSTHCELIDFFRFSDDHPSASSLNQQKAKLKPEAFEALFREFNRSVVDLNIKTDKSTNKRYRFIAADGSTASFYCQPGSDTECYFVSEGHSMKGFYSIHINAMYDLDNNTYTDILLQPVHEKDEFSAFCTLVDTHDYIEDYMDVFIGDRGYCSYNNMAHVVKNGHYFLFRTKDSSGRGILNNFDFSCNDTFNEVVTLSLTRCNRKDVDIRKGTHRRFICKNINFDYLEYGSRDVFELTFRAVRFMLTDGSYECVVTNLPPDEFPPNKLMDLYCRRWNIETSFRKLKYTIGMMNFHSRKPQYIKQEIWAKLIAYNATELMIQLTAIENKRDRKYQYKVSFTAAAHLCRIYLRLTTEIDSIDVTALLRKELIPVRDDRQFKRLQTAHFRKPKYFCYRAA